MAVGVWGGLGKKGVGGGQEHGMSSSGRGLCRALEV
jgi:hypothetical protein